MYSWITDKAIIPGTPKNPDIDAVTTLIGKWKLNCVPIILITNNATTPTINFTHNPLINRIDFIELPVNSNKIILTTITDTITIGFIPIPPST
jgi:hypothetical protein